MSDIPQSLTPEVVILNVSFDEDYDALQITFIETRNIGANGFMQGVVTVAASELNKEELADVVDSLVQFVDAGLLHIRNTEGKV